MTPAETGLLIWIHGTLSTPAADCFFGAVTDLGRPKVLAVLFALQAAFFWLRRQRGPFRLTLGVGLGAAVLCQLKCVVARARPEYWAWGTSAEGFAFPSGHALVSAAYFFLLAWLLTRSWPYGTRIFWTLAVVLAALIGFSRLYLGVHWPTDVVAGWILGSALVVLAARSPRRCPGSWDTRIEGLDEVKKVAGTF